MLSKKTSKASFAPSRIINMYQEILSFFYYSFLQESCAGYAYEPDITYNNIWQAHTNEELYVKSEKISFQIYLQFTEQLIKRYWQLIIITFTCVIYNMTGIPKISELLPFTYVLNITWCMQIFIIWDKLLIFFHYCIICVFFLIFYFFYIKFSTQ